MVLDSLLCLCLDQHAYVFFAMFLLRSTCQCLDLWSYAQIYVFMCSVPCLCTQIYVGCYAMCYFSPFYPLISLFLTFWPFQQGVDLDPVVQAYIHTPRSISKGVDLSFLCMSMFAYQLLCFISMLDSLYLGFAMLCALYGLMLAWLHSSLLGFVWMYPCVGYTPVVLVCLIYAFLHPLRCCLPCLLCTTRLAFFASLHLCMLAYMFMHEFVCRLYSIPMELWTLDPILHLFSQDTPFCLITCFFAFSCASHVYLPLFGIFPILFQHASPSICFFACLLACFCCLCMYMHGTGMLGARAQPSRCEQKR